MKKKSVALELQQFLAAEQNLVWNKTWQYTLLGKKENNSAEEEGFLYVSLPPPSCQKQGKWKQKVES